jgi:predicted transcriptional regulator
MIPGLQEKREELRRRREELGLTQQELADRADLSQSFIAKLEAGSISPGYRKIRRLERALSTSDEPTAADYLVDPVTVSVDDRLSDCVELVLDEGYAVVVEDGVQRGSLTPRTLVPLTAGDRSRTAGNVMEDSFPEIIPHTPRGTLRSLLSFSPVLIVTEEGSVVGAVTRRSFVGEELEF